jgi:type II secretory pathway predicted ATPase ExeA
MNLLQPMLEYFGLRKQPFAPTADPAYFYATPQHRECLCRIWTGVEGGFGPVVVLSSPGTGKTLLMRKVLSHMALEPDRYNTAVIASPSPTWTAMTLLEAMLDGFGLTSDGGSFSTQLDAFYRYLLEQPERINVLIVDDAQSLTRRGQIELLRLTQNIETPERKLLNLVIFAQMSWRNALQEADSFSQRANAIVTLPPLSRDDLQRMVEFRLRQAGAADSTGFFTPEALRVIHERSHGIPRTALTLCRNSLIVAALAKTRPIGAEVVDYTVERTFLTEPELMAPPPSATPALEEEFDRESDSAALPEMGPKRGTRPHEEQANQLLLRAARQRQA